MAKVRLVFESSKLESESKSESKSESPVSSPSPESCGSRGSPSHESRVTKVESESKSRVTSKNQTKLEIKCLLGQTHGFLEKFRFNQIIIDDVTVILIFANVDHFLL